MFGEVYKIKEEEIPKLVKKAKADKLRRILISYVFVAIGLTLVYYPLYNGQGIAFVFPVLLIFSAIILIVFLKARRIQYEKIYKSFELTISEGSITCVNTSIKPGKPISIQFTEISKITHYVNDSLLIIGTDLSHAFSIPNQIENRKEIIEKLSSVQPIKEGKKEKNLYYLQRFNMWLFILSIFGIIGPNNSIINGLSCAIILYTTFLPIYFFITTRKLGTRIKIVNSLFLLLAFFFISIGVSKILHPL
jgi:hypothetical protein